jgi:16S rRNA (cytosine1402-N4)-methyltransferase
MPASTYHVPVMSAEIMQYTVTDPAGIYVDCTAGGGGHAAALLSHYPKLTVIAVDCDPEAVATTGTRLAIFGGRAIVVRDNFQNIAAIVATHAAGKINGIYADLGVSSHQLDRQERGFCFTAMTLDMRMDDRLPLTAADLVNTLDEKELADTLYQYGDEYRSRPIARAIVNARQKARITTAAELAGVIERVKHRQGKTHPATQTFQALRIAVNREMENLDTLLADAPAALAAGGRMTIISYHSLEDRRVKRSLREQAAQGVLRLITKKVLRPTDQEIAANPRSRSARLRVAEKCA